MKSASLQEKWWVLFVNDGDRKDHMTFCMHLFSNVLDGIFSYCGFIVKNSVHSSEGSTAAERVIFRALDRRIPPIKIKTTQAHSLLGNRIVVSIDSWPVNSV